MTDYNVDLYIESEIENVLNIKKSPINVKRMGIIS